jgi:ubiquinone/menaquinone biosynthesis C-methylase UbiE
MVMVLVWHVMWLAVAVCGGSPDRCSSVAASAYNQQPFGGAAGSTFQTPLSHPLFIAQHSQTPMSAVIRALVAGGGTGDQTVYFAQQCQRHSLSCEIIHLDVSETAVRVAEQRCLMEGLSDISFVVGDIAVALENTVEQFDFVSCFGVLHHLADAGRGFQALARSLRPGGILSASVFSYFGRSDIRTLSHVSQLLGGVNSSASAAREFMRSAGLMGSTAQEASFTDAEYEIIKNNCTNTYSVHGVVGMAEAAGFEFPQFLPSALYDIETYIDLDVSAGGSLASVLKKQSVIQQLALTEATGKIPKHYFFCRKRKKGVLNTPLRLAKPPTTANSTTLCRAHDSDSALSVHHHQQHLGSTSAVDIDINVELFGFTATFSVDEFKIFRRCDCATTLGAMFKMETWDKTWEQFMKDASSMRATAESLGLIFPLMQQSQNPLGGSILATV